MSRTRSVHSVLFLLAVLLFPNPGAAQADSIDWLASARLSTPLPTRYTLEGAALSDRYCFAPHPGFVTMFRVEKGWLPLVVEYPTPGQLQSMAMINDSTAIGGRSGILYIVSATGLYRPDSIPLRTIYDELYIVAGNNYVLVSTRNYDGESTRLYLYKYRAPDRLDLLDSVIIGALGRGTAFDGRTCIVNANSGTDVSVLLALSIESDSLRFTQSISPHERIVSVGFSTDLLAMALDYGPLWRQDLIILRRVSGRYVQETAQQLPADVRLSGLVCSRSTVHVLVYPINAPYHLQPDIITYTRLPSDTVWSIVARSQPAYPLLTFEPYAYRIANYKGGLLYLDRNGLQLVRDTLDPTRVVDDFWSISRRCNAVIEQRENVVLATSAGLYTMRFINHDSLEFVDSLDVAAASLTPIDDTTFLANGRDIVIVRIEADGVLRILARQPLPYSRLADKVIVLDSARILAGAVMQGICLLTRTKTGLAVDTMMAMPFVGMHRITPDLVAVANYKEGAILLNPSVGLTATHVDQVFDAVALDGVRDTIIGTNGTNISSVVWNSADSLFRQTRGVGIDDVFSVHACFARGGHIWTGTTSNQYVSVYANDSGRAGAKIRTIKGPLGGEVFVSDTRAWVPIGPNGLALFTPVISSVSPAVPAEHNHSAMLFPNPTSGRVTVRSVEFGSDDHAPSIYRARLISIDGRREFDIEMHHNVVSKEILLDCTGLPSGAYLLVLVSEQGHTVLESNLILVR